MAHLYKIHTDDGSVKTVSVEKHHTHSDFGGDIKKWFAEHQKAIGIIAGSIMLIEYGNITLWKK